MGVSRKVLIRNTSSPCMGDGGCGGKGKQKKGSRYLWREGFSGSREGRSGRQKIGCRWRSDNLVRERAMEKHREKKKTQGRT